VTGIPFKRFFKPIFDLIFRVFFENRLLTRARWCSKYTYVKTRPLAASKWRKNRTRENHAIYKIKRPPDNIIGRTTESMSPRYRYEFSFAFRENRLANNDGGPEITERNTERFFERDRPTLISRQLGQCFALRTEQHRSWFVMRHG